jgi:hypothetical protein
VKRLAHYASLWRTLPEDERRARAGRVIERIFRRDPTVRRLGFVGDQPSWRSFRRALNVPAEDFLAALRRASPSRGPLHVDLTARAERVATRHALHADEIMARSHDLLERRFDLLGSGPTRPLREDGGVDWHLDFKTGVRWEPGDFYLDVPIVRGDGSDIKVPWELSRFQHLAILGQAYHLAPHRRTRDEAEKLRVRLATEAAAQIDDWIVSNPRGLGVNWACTMDVAIRAYNWVAALGLFRGAREWDDAFLLRLARSLWVHGRHIRRNLEIGGDGLTSNHYLSDVVGLYAVACAIPELHESEAWRTFGHHALIEEMDRQVLPDGADFERSIPYHRLVTELFAHGAIFARSVGDSLPDAFGQRFGKMLEFIATYTRPDGSAPQWGDNDDGRLLPLDGYAAHDPHDHRHLLDLGGRLYGRHDLVHSAGGRDVESSWLLDPARDRSAAFPADASSRGFESVGYYVLRAADLHLGVPCGPVGTRGVGNHTHNDLFSLCLWAGGREWITDPGTGSYTSDPEIRNRLRSTSAHSTVQIGEREQNRFGPAIDDLFAVDETARPQVLAWSPGGEVQGLSARHGGSGTGSHVEHLREIRFIPGRRAFTVRDRLTVTNPGGEEAIRLRLPLSPGVSVADPDADGSAADAVLALLPEATRPGYRRRVVVLDGGGGRRLWIGLVLPEGFTFEVASAIVSPRYGVTTESPVLIVTLSPRPEIETVTAIISPEPARS